jgi:hypothetical protein
MATWTTGEVVFVVILTKENHNQDSTNGIATRRKFTRRWSVVAIDFAPDYRRRFR